MARNFDQYPALAYIGQPSAIPINLQGITSQAVELNFAWLIYGASSAVPNLVVNVDLGAAPIRSAMRQIRSIYVDNTNSDFPVYIQFPDTLYTIVCKPNSTGWFPVYSMSWQFQVAILGMVTGDIPTTTMLVTNCLTHPSFSDETPESLQLKLASPQIGSGGAPLASIAANPTGQSYTGNGLSIVGGGGSGAAAHGILDQFGRFVGVVIDNPGIGFRGTPIITPTASNPARAAWLITTTYATGAIVSFNGTEWIRSGALINGKGTLPAWNGGTAYSIGAQVTASDGNNYTALHASTNINPVGNPGFWQQSNPVAPNADPGWTNSGTAGGTNAQFQATLGVAAQSIFSPGYAPAALGDQLFRSFSTVNANGGLFADNVFGSPYGSGFIHLTSIEAVVLNFSVSGFGVGQWELLNSVGNEVIADFEYSGGNGVGNFILPCVVSRMSGLDLKIDATQQWQLKMISLGGFTSVQVAHRIAYTISQR